MVLARQPFEMLHQIMHGLMIYPGNGVLDGFGSVKLGEGDHPSGEFNALAAL